jgi:hypothetical protein
VADPPTDPNQLGPTFISYRQSDGLDLAIALAWSLRAAGVPVWHDQTDLPPGDTSRRLAEALDGGLSGAVLLVTEEIANSTVVQDIELPSLLELEADPAFTFAVASTIPNPDDPTKLDYNAPDRLLGTPSGTISRLNQSPMATAADRTRLAAALARRRIEQLRDDIAAAGGQLTLDVQTRIPPFAAKHDAHLVLRLRPPQDGERRPHIGGLDDLQEFLRELPQLVTIGGAHSVRVRGGAHLSVACALGAALPTTLIGTITALDTAGDAWSLDGQAPVPDTTPLLEPVDIPVAAGATAGPVLAYIDLLPQRSDLAYTNLITQTAGNFSGILHLRPRAEGLLEPDAARQIVGELNAAIRDLAGRHGTSEVHLLLRCPYPIALLLGRSLNTLTAHLYEWENGSGPGESEGDRYLPSLVLRPGVGGTPIQTVTAPRPTTDQEP